MTVHLNTPVAGCYRRRFRRGEPYSAIAILDVTPRDEEGRYVADQTFEAFVDGKLTDIDRVWPAGDPIEEAEYLALLEANRLAIGGNNPPPATLLEEAAALAADAPFMTDTAEKIDAVKRITGLKAELVTARREATAELAAQQVEIETPYEAAMDNLDAAKEALLAEIHTARKAGETLRGRYASAFGRKIGTLLIEAADQIPREFCSPDESKIKAALKAGQVVPGARLAVGEATTVS